MFLFWGGSLRLPNNSLLASHCGGSRNLQRRRSVGWCSRVCVTVEACTCWFDMCSPLGRYLGSQVATQSASDEQRRYCVMVICIFLDGEDPFWRRQVIQQCLNRTPSIQVLLSDYLPLTANIGSRDQCVRILLLKSSHYLYRPYSSMCH